MTATKTRPAKRTSKAPAKPKVPAGEWLTPTQISKEDGMPAHAVQLMYGYIKQGKLEARRAEGVKGQLVDAVLARQLLAQRGTRGGARPRPPSGPKEPAAPLARPGTIVSREGSTAANGHSPSGKRKLEVVTETGRSSIITTANGKSDMQWRTDSMRKRIKEGTTQIESVVDVLAIAAFSLKMNGNREDAEGLLAWAEGSNLVGVKAVFDLIDNAEPWNVAQEGDEEPADEEAS